MIDVPSENVAISAESHAVEVAADVIELLPAPTDRHQRVLGAVFTTILAYAASTGGRARVGARLLVAPDTLRQPDVLLRTAANLPQRNEEPWRRADLVVEVVSGGSKDRIRDLVTKRSEYARCGVPEYWIVDPEHAFVTVLRLAGAEYVEAGLYERGRVARSASLQGLELDVRAALDAP